MFTGIGGHYLNRRWDKAILFLCLYVLITIVTYGFFIYTIQNLSVEPGEMATGISDTYQLILKIFSIGISIVWVVSLIVTILDCKNQVEPTVVKWTGYGIMSATLTSFLSLIFLFFSVATFVSIFKVDNYDSHMMTSESSSFNTAPSPFYEYLYFGGNPSDDRNLSAPPTGEGLLNGKIMFETMPAEGVSLSIVLNSKYRVKNLVTDSNGMFSISLPVGMWRINSIQTTSWANKPGGESYSMFSGEEEKLKGNRYDRHAYFGKNGYPVTITKNSSTIHLDATINKDIHLIWPNSNSKTNIATMNDTISWEKYPNATNYYVEIKKIRRDGNTTHYEQITSRVISEKTSIQLLSLKHIKTKNKIKREYSAEIYAFSEDGTPIAEFSETYRGGTFFLPDGIILIEDSMGDHFDLATTDNSDENQKTLEAISLNKRRVEAVLLLIDENMFQKAKSLLNIVESKYSQGQKEILTGYIMALEGECFKAKEMFDLSLTINPDACIPDLYTKNCE